jgi:DNA-binding CsgD family transcriptional regulator/GAF domain-containing protein
MTAGSAQLVRFARKVTEASSFDGLERTFAAGFGPLVGAPMYGFYALEPGVSRIQHNVAVNVSDLFVARYRDAMGDDPLLSHAQETGRPTYNRDLMSEPEWEETAIYRRAYSTHTMRHVAEIPIAGEDGIVGALHFAACRPERDFAAEDLRLAEAVAGVLAVAIRRIRTGWRSERELAQTRAALELAGTAIVISEPGAPELRLNATARQLLEEVHDGDERLHELLARPPYGGRIARRSEVRLTSGAQGLLHAHSDRMPAGELVTVLELARERPGVDRRLLTCVTPREAEVATLVVEGLSDREIADELALSRYTVSQYVKRVYAKLGVDSRVALTRLLLGAPPTVRRT